MKAFFINLKAMLGHYSTYWTFLCTMAAAWYVQAPVAEVDYVLSFVPLLTLTSASLSPVKGIATFLFGYIALKGWPQGDDAKKAE